MILCSHTPWRLVRAAVAILSTVGFLLAAALAYTPPIIYFPGQDIGEVADADLNEIAGMTVGQRNDELLWVHNGGSATQVHALQYDGTVRASLTLPFSISEMDDAATGPGPTADIPYLYFGDIGGNRTSVAVIRAPEPLIGSGSIPLSPLPDAERIELNYPDGAHIAETLMIDPLSGDLMIATRESNRTRFYQATAVSIAEGSSTTLTLVGEANFSLASAGAISTDGRLIAIRNEDAAIMWRRSPGQTIAEAIAGIPTPIPMVGEPTENKGRAFCFDTHSSAYLTTGQGKEEIIYLYRPNASGFNGGEALGEVEDEDLKELSGCAASQRNPGVLWVHNDGDIDHLFAISSEGRTLARLELGTSLVDCEDIAVGPGPATGEPYLYIGDVGDNDSNRPTIAVLRLPEPLVDHAWAGDPRTIDASAFETLELQYPDRSYDCETLMVDPLTGQLLVATKEDDITQFFSAPISSSSQVIEMTYVAQVPFSVASGGDISFDGREIILRNEDEAALWTRHGDVSIAEAVATPGREVPVMGRPKEPNGEAISFAVDGSGYFTVSEKKNEPVFLFRRIDRNQLIGFSAPPERGPDSVVLSVQGVPGITATLEFSDNLETWSTLSPVQIGEDSETITDPESESARYYRLRF